ncbi:helix-turn-helix domain-containing protein [Streptomyces asiaticus]
MSELFDAVDALVASRAPLPPPEERRRLRKAHGLTVEEVAAALKVRRATVSGWESGKTEPRPPERDAYARLLKQLAELYPAPTGAAAPVREAAVPKTSTGTPTPAPKPRTLPASPASDAAATTASGTTPPLLP